MAFKHKCKIHSSHLAEWRVVNQMRVDFVWSKNGTNDVFQTILDPNGRDGLKLDAMLMVNLSETSTGSHQSIESSNIDIDAYSRNTNW